MWKDRCFIWEGVQDPKKRYAFGWYGGRGNSGSEGERRQAGPTATANTIAGPPGFRPPPKCYEWSGMPPQLTSSLGCFTNGQIGNVIRNGVIFLVLTSCSHKRGSRKDTGVLMLNLTGFQLDWEAGQGTWSEHATLGFSGWPSTMNQIIIKKLFS